MKVYATQYDVISWLQFNVGPLQFTSPTSEWYGKGWSVRVREEFCPKDGNFITTYCDVKIYDEQKALIFALRWT